MSSPAGRPPLRPPNEHLSGVIFVVGRRYDALAAGELFGAGLDVWWQYPTSYAEAARARPSSDAAPFHELDSVVMSPHRGGGVGVPGLELVRLRHVGAMLTAAGRDGVERMPHRWKFDLGY